MGGKVRCGGPEMVFIVLLLPLPYILPSVLYIPGSSAHGSLPLSLPSALVLLQILPVVVKFLMMMMMMMKWRELVLPASAAVTGPVIVVVVEAPTPTVAVAVVAVRPVRNERVAVQPAAVLVSSSPAVARVHLHRVVEAQGSVQHDVVGAGARTRLARPVAWYVVAAGSHVDVQGSAVGLVGGIVLALNLKSPPVQIKGGGFAQQKERG